MQTFKSTFKNPLSSPSLPRIVGDAVGRGGKPQKHKNMNSSIKLISILLLLIASGCHEEWLDIKQDKKVVVPQTLTDLQALLDNSSVINLSSTPMLGELSSDNIYIADDDWYSIAYAEQRNAYIWADDVYEGNTSYDWNSPYAVVLLANLALEGLEKIDPAGHEQQEWNHIRGRALFYRSWMFFHLAQIYSKQYNASTADTDLGIVLRLESDVNLVSKRATVQQTYDQVIGDVKEALDLLPKIPTIQTRPGVAAAHGLLAKAYLQMNNYEQALIHSKAALEIHNDLMDFNDLDVEADYPFDQMNKEVIYHSTITSVSNLLGILQVHPDVYDLYQPNDLRRMLYFFENQGKLTFRCTYDASTRQFNGVATDELFLIAAECEARGGNITIAMKYLNDLLRSRWVTGTYTPLTANSIDEALKMIFTERQKSLLMRGIRWMDLKRLNQEEKFASILNRSVDGVTYTLNPGDPKYVFPIPDDVIDLSGMEQNPR